MSKQRNELVSVVSVNQAAALLGITRRAVISRIHAGTLEAVKLGPGTAAYVIARSEIERVLAEAAAAAPEAS